MAVYLKRISLMMHIHTHLIFALLEGTSAHSYSRITVGALRPRFLLLAKQLFHAPHIDLVVLLSHGQRPYVGFAADLLLRNGLPVEAANSAFLA